MMHMTRPFLILYLGMGIANVTLWSAAIALYLGFLDPGHFIDKVAHPKNAMNVKRNV